MAIISRFFFTRYKEVSYQTLPGQVSDNPYGSFSLDDPTQTNAGTIHFFGVMETRHLLGDLRKITIDTGNTTLFEYDSLPQTEIDIKISTGQFQLTDQRIGWVDLGKATPSFFYNDCNLFSPVVPDGKRPTVNYFYDISQLGLDGNIVSGEQVSSTTTQFLVGGPPIPELEVIGTFNVTETNLSWGPYPTVRYTNPSFQGDDIRQFGVSFDFYIQRVIDGSTWPSRTGQIQSGVALNVIQQSNTQLVSAGKEDHFDNQNSEKIGNRYGSVRRVMSNGFRSFGQSSVGNCLELPYRTTSGGPSVSVGTGGAQTTQGFFNFYINDGNFSQNLTHTEITSVPSDILYQRFDDLDQPSAVIISSPYTLPENVFNDPNSYNPFDDQWYNPNTSIIPPPIPPPEIEKRGDPIRDMEKQSFSKDMICTVSSPFSLPERNPWVSENSYNFNFDNNSTFKVQYKNDSSIYDLKVKVKNSGLSFEEYEKKLLFIKEEIKKEHDQILRG